MFARYFAALGAIAVIGTTGCASHSIDVPPPEPVHLGSDIPAFHAPEDPDLRQIAGADLVEPTGALVLRDAMALALMKNPELAAFSWEVRARDAEIVQANLRRR